MTEHPITPPPELIQRWSEQFEAGRSLYAMFEDIYRAGADAELEACCEWLQDPDLNVDTYKLRAARRPKPKSLKEQALEQLDGIAAVFRMSHGGDLVCDTIRRALEALPE
jgi:hypothetical protein